MSSLSPPREVQLDKAGGARSYRIERINTIKKKKTFPPADFRGACERLSAVLMQVAFHPNCPASVKADLLGVCLDIGGRPTEVEAKRERFDVMFAFSALASGQPAE
jgi:hypothetical protein